MPAKQQQPDDLHINEPGMDHRGGGGTRDNAGMHFTSDEIAVMRKSKSSKSAKSVRSVRSSAFYSCLSDSEEEDDVEKPPTHTVDPSDWAREQAITTREKQPLTISAFRHAANRALVTFHGVTKAVPGYDGDGFANLFEDVCGALKPGELTAIIGSEEEEVDALMGVLSGLFPERAYSGTIKCNGTPIGPWYTRLVGHVLKENICMSRSLSVWQNLMLSMQLRMRATRSVMVATVESVLETTELSDYANERVSNLDKEKRLRLMIGLELLLDPPILFIEYPTSVLGNSASLSIMQLLRRLAHKGKAVVASLHQPRWAVYNLVDTLLLLHGGMVAYYGPAGEQAIEFFQLRGNVWNRNYTPTDFLLQLCATKQEQVDGLPEWGGSDEDTNHPQNDAVALANLYHDSPQYQELAKLFASAEAAADEDIRMRNYETPPEWKRMIILLKLIAMRNRAHWQWNLVKFLGVLCIALMTGKLYEAQDNNQKGMQNRVGISFFIMIVLMLANVPFATTIIRHRPVLLHQLIGGQYSVLTHWVVLVVWDVVLVRGFVTVLFSIIVYYLTSLERIGNDLGSFVGITTVTQTAFCSLSMAIGTWSRDESAASTILLFLFSFFIVTGGLLINLTSIPKGLEWMERASLVRYGYESVLVTMFHNRTFECSPQDLAPHGFNDGCYTGDGYLELQGFKVDSKWSNMYTLIVISVVLLLLSLIALALLRPTVILRRRFRPWYSEFVTMVKSRCCSSTTPLTRKASGGAYPQGPDTSSPA